MVAFGRVPCRPIPPLALLRWPFARSGHAWFVKLSTGPRPGLPPRSTFAGFRFPAEVIVVAIRWYLGYGLSYRDVEELLVDRGVEVDHVTGAGLHPP